MSIRPRLARAAVVLFLFGTLSLTRLLTRPSIETMRAVDGVQLFGTGMCFGAGVLALALLAFGPRPPKA